MYDVIIHGATLSGIAAAVMARREVKSVLLINYYGFPGGSVTESLCCRQNKKYWSGSDSFISELKREIASEKWGILSEDDESITVNPEVIKYVLQRNLVQREIELLFHVQPVELIKQEDHFRLNLLAKEGIISAEGRMVIDASENMSLTSLVSPFDRKIKKMRLNLFTTKLPVPEKPLLPALEEFVILTDQRAWMSVTVDENEPLEAEKASQHRLEEITSAIEGSGSSLQLVPPAAYIEFETPQTDIGLPEGFILLSKIRENKIQGAGYEFCGAFETERAITETGLFKGKTEDE